MVMDQAADKAFTEGGADLSVQSQARASLIERGPGVAGVDVFGAGGALLLLGLQQAADQAPPWSYYPGRRDAFLRRFWKQEPGLASAVYSLSTRIKTLNYEVDGGRNQKKYYQDLAGAADFGRGMPSLVSKTVTDLLTQDNGAFWELVGAGDPNGPMVGPVRGVAHLDSAQCWRTFDPEYPVVYHNPQTGRWHRLHTSRVVMMSSLPQPNELARGIGFCAVSRALSWVQTMRAVNTYRHEKITGTQPAIGYGNGFTDKIFRTATEYARNKAEAEGFVIWNGIPFLLNPDGDAKVSLDLISIKGLPDGYEYQDELTLYIYSLSFAFGVDAREFWPATVAGATKADATVQHLKAQGRGIGDLIQTIEWAWNWHILPEGCTLRYDFTDDEQDRLAAEIERTQVETYTAIRHAGGMNAKQYELHLIAAGVLDPVLMEQGADVPDTPPTDSAATGATTEASAEETNAAQPADELGGMKDYGEVRARFVDALAELFSEKDDLTRRQLASALRSTLRSAGLQAFHEGLSQGGADVESLSQDELAVFRDWQTQQSAFVTDLGSALYKDGVEIHDARAKATLWANKSLDDIYYRGVAIAAPKKRYTWRLGATKDHCSTCAANDGQTKTMAEWEAAGLPRSHGLECGGWFCDCRLEEVS